MTAEELKNIEQVQNAEKWKQVRTACRQAKQEYERLEREFVQAEREVQRVDRDIANAQAALDYHRENAPTPDDFPTDEEMNMWKKQEADIIAAFEPLRAERGNATHNREDLRLKAVRVAAELENLMHAERNAREKASGNKLATGWQGAVTRV
jgi:predicted  nucleic acid-binding Zn-ribbon protein